MIFIYEVVFYLRLGSIATANKSSSLGQPVVVVDFKLLILTYAVRARHSHGVIVGKNSEKKCVSYFTPYAYLSVQCVFVFYAYGVKYGVFRIPKT